MYEARQNKEKVSRRIENNIKNIHSKNKVYIPHIYVSQMMLTRKNRDAEYKKNRLLARFSNNDVEHRNSLEIFIHNLNYYIDTISTVDFNGLLSFYSVYFSNNMGPHTIAHSSLNETIYSLSKEHIADSFYQLIQTPDQIEMILAKEAVYYPASKFNDGAGLDSPRLNSYMSTYSNLYNICSNIVHFFQDNMHFINIIEQQNYSDDNANYASEIEQLWISLQNTMVKLLNLNPYATYAWHREDGYTNREISGKGESRHNLFDITNEEDFRDKLNSFFDIMSLQSMTFYDIDGFINYICLFFPKIHKSSIKETLLSIPNDGIMLPPITISEEEINQYFIDILENSYSYSLKKIATKSIIENVDMKLFVNNIINSGNAINILNEIFTILHSIYDSYDYKIFDLIYLLANIEDEEFTSNLIDILSEYDEYIDMYTLIESLD